MTTSRLMAISLIALCSCAPAAAPEERWLEVAADAARWIDSAARATDAGMSWAVTPSAPDRVAEDLYSGGPGIVLFYLDLYAAAGDTAALERAVGGARELAASMPADDDVEAAGLYTGLAGRCFAIARAAADAVDAGLAATAHRCVDTLIAAGADADHWGPVTDIIGGSAGIGAFLLWATESLDRPDALAAASRAGDALLEAAIAVPGGLKWAMAPDFPRLMPNFSHGTAGIAFFLARLYQATSEHRYLEGAIAGGRYLQSIAETEGELCLIFHNEPEGEELFYLSWCHGPAGTGRTFYSLWQATGDAEWLEWTHRSAAAILASGLPEERSAGFWNNVGLCCGNAGVVEFFLDLYAASGREEYLEFARRVADDLIAHATRDGSGTRWVQAEHRVRPDELVAQTGLMQGAAGMARVLLQLRAVEAGVAQPVALPDNPFARLGSISGPR